MLVGSCQPTIERFKVTQVRCVRPGCGYVATAMTESAGLLALGAHLEYAATEPESPHGRQ